MLPLRFASTLPIKLLNVPTYTKNKHINIEGLSKPRYQLISRQTTFCTNQLLPRLPHRLLRPKILPTTPLTDQRLLVTIPIRRVVLRLLLAAQLAHRALVLLQSQVHAESTRVHRVRLWAPGLDVPELVAPAGRVEIQWVVVVSGIETEGGRGRLVGVGGTRRLRRIL